MNIAAYIRTSTIDYPGHISSVVFTKGCNMRCEYCHNKDLEVSSDNISMKNVINHLSKRKGLLDGVTITGGEPTMQTGLIKFCKKVKSMGFKIKLDTNGTNPEVVKELIDSHLVDYIAMDFKTSPKKYQELSGISFEKVKKSYEIIRMFHSYEFRTTLYPTIDKDDVLEILEMVNKENYYIQQYRKNNDFDLDPYENEYVKTLCDELKLKHRGI
ncbi:MAG: anaerobic ribonucleoside-triphosphate reductase activating protein [Bacillota bacterium]|nr:anaerobic ribonucleoside-triphosphate reductase activating protein [Bacillota bacterium]